MIEPPRLHKRANFLPDLTALIDVIFLLLVFLLLSVGTQLKAFKVDLPDAPSSDATTAVQSTSILLEILPNALIVDGVELDDEGALVATLAPLLETSVQAEQSRAEDTPPRKRLVVALDKDLDVDRMLDILIRLREGDIEAADILIKPE